MSEFGQRVEAFLRGFFRLYPVAATAAGNHDHDGRWPDLSIAGRRERLEFIDRWQAELRAMTEVSLSPDERIDREMLVSELDALRFDESELQEWAWDPLSYVYLMGSGIFPLLARDFAPLAARLRSVASRMEHLPAVIEGAKSQLGTVNARPVSQLHLEMALRQLPGIGSLADDAVAQARTAAPTEPEVEALLPRLEKAADKAEGCRVRLRTLAEARDGAPLAQRGTAGARSVCPQAAPNLPHRADRRTDPDSGPPGVRRRPGGDDPHRPQDLEGVGAGGAPAHGRSRGQRGGSRTEDRGSGHRRHRPGPPPRPGARRFLQGIVPRDSRFLPGEEV